MSQPIFENDVEYYPPEYKIVDLPIIDIPVIVPLANFNAKVYRFSDTDGEWKRMCYGKIKIFQDQYNIVSAFENWTFHMVWP